jgi:serine protease Do
VNRHLLTSVGLLALALSSTGCGSTAHANPPGAATPTEATATEARRDSAPLAGARQLGEAFVEVARGVSPSVVALRVEARVASQRTPFGFNPFGPPQQMEPPIAHGMGSGVVIRADGYVLTNNHVVDGARRIEVVLSDGRSLIGTVVGTDPATDLAVVRIEASGLPAARFARSDDVRVGEWAIAIGSPLGLDYSVTTGVVSALGRAGLGAAEIEDYVQTDASINPGNSGGPLVNLDGEVIGINTMIAGRGTGIGFAVPADIARQVADQIIDDGAVTRAWIGVSFQELTPDLARGLGVPDGSVRGALVASTLPDAPAARGGIKPGDVVVAVDGEPVEEGHDLLRRVLRRRVGETIALEVIREGRRETFSVTTTARPPSDDMRSAAPPARRRNAPQAQSHGLALAPLDPRHANQLGV